MIGPKTDADRDTVVKILAEIIGKGQSMSAEQANQATNGALTGMEQVYGASPKCPFKKEDSHFSRYCYVKAFADQIRILKFNFIKNIYVVR